MEDIATSVGQRPSWYAGDPTIYAYTPAVPDPPYLNVRRAGLLYQVTVRSRASEVESVSPPPATITLGRAEMVDLFRALADELKPEFRLRLGNF